MALSKPTVTVAQGSVDEQALRQQYGDNINITYGNNQFVGNNRYETNKMYNDYLSGHGLSPVNNNIDLSKLSGVQAVGGVVQPQPQNFNAQAEMANMQGMLGQMSGAYLQQQKAQLDMMLESQLTQLKMAYEQAIADGQISVRDAEQAFAEQKQQIEKQAYFDAEQTSLYGQEMGVQNSQQMIGLMQGDQARKNSMINQNMTTRDRRIADIQDRLKSIKMQKDLEIARVTAEHGHGLLKAQGEAGMMYSQGMFGLMGDNFKANQQQQFARENMATQHQYGLQQLQEQSRLRVDEMMVGHKLDLDKMAQSLKDAIQLEGVRFGNQKALQTKEARDRIAEMTAKAELEMKNEQRAYELARDRELAKLDPNTPEYKIKAMQLEDTYKNNVANVHAATLYEFYSQQFFDPSLPPLGVTPQEPVKNKYPLGLVGDWLSNHNYNNQMKEYNAMMEAIQRRQGFINNPMQFMPNPYGK